MAPISAAASLLQYQELFQLLPKLRNIVLHECEAWSRHMKISRATQYSDIITQANGDPKNAAAKGRALIYLLETLPARYAALAKTNQAEQIELSETNDNLLNQLKTSPCDVKLSKAHEYLLSDPDTARQVKMQEVELGELEMLRMEVLSKMKRFFVTRGFENFQKSEDVVAVIEAMEAVGISVESALSGHVETAA